MKKSKGKRNEKAGPPLGRQLLDRQDQDQDGDGDGAVTLRQKDLITSWGLEVVDWRITHVQHIRTERWTRP